LTDSADLERSNRALSEAAYLIAHDLAEPLRAVSGFARLLERRCGGQLDDSADEYLAHIVAGARRMDAMLAGLSAFVASERSPIDLESVDVTALVGSLVGERMAKLHGLGGEIAVGDLPGARADPRLVRDLFARLLDNAIRFRGEAPPWVEILGERAGDQVHYAVVDRGIGIPAGEEETVVKLFRRASNAADHVGVGVGLAIAERIAGRHGGALSIAAREGGGAVVRVSLPAAST